MTESSGRASGIGIDEGASVARRKSLSEGYYLLGLAMPGKGNLQKHRNFLPGLLMFSEIISGPNIFWKTG